jgi:hypothetical protein
MYVAQSASRLRCQTCAAKSAIRLRVRHIGKVAHRLRVSDILRRWLTGFSVRRIESNGFGCQTCCEAGSRLSFRHVAKSSSRLGVSGTRWEVV